MKRSLFLKVFGGYVGLLLLLAAAFLLFSFGTIKRHYMDTLAGELENVGRALDARIFELLDQNRLSDLETFLQENGKKVSARLTVIDSEGAVKAESEEDPAGMESHRFRPEISEALEGRIGRSLRYSNTLKAQMLYVALPLVRGGRVEGVLRLSLFVRDIDVLLRAIRRDIGRAVGILIVISIFGAFLFSRSLTRPMGLLIQASRRVAAGDFSARVKVRSADEWRDLAATFNETIARVEALFLDLKKRKEELDNIMASMQEGLLVIDRKGKIMLANRSAKAIIGLDTLEGKFYWEVIRITPFVDHISRVKAEKTSRLEEFVLGEKTILCQVAFLPIQEGIVVTLHDITEVQNLARIKKDFVLNVSHELRTPLTAIKGYAETLEEESSARTRGYAETILRHTDRLIRIVEDLISLASLEEKDLAHEPERVNLKQIAENVVRIFEPRAKEKNLELRFEAVVDLPPIDGDPFRLEQIFINLVENAVKYTEKGSVYVRLEKVGGGVVIEVRDTGIGIPLKDQSRVFERFYVVDKSRSRKTGGTGLGLSIVKHIVLLHGGRIDVQSTPGVGSTFRVFLPSPPVHAA
jgi:two-component system, OmpR family, phosphate regulon sensor histidine kinase PhoR